MGPTVTSFFSIGAGDLSVLGRAEADDLAGLVATIDFTFAGFTDVFFDLLAGAFFFISKRIP